MALIFCGRGIPGNRRVDKLVYLNDIYPTLCSLVGFTIPGTVEGISLKEAFTQANFKGRDHAFFAYSNQQRAIVYDGYKLIRYNVNSEDHPQLFNLNKDPAELHNLADDYLYQSKFKEMTNLLAEEMKRQDDYTDLNKPGWGYPQKWIWKEWRSL